MILHINSSHRLFAILFISLLPFVACQVATNADPTAKLPTIAEATVSVPIPTLVPPTLPPTDVPMLTSETSRLPTATSTPILTQSVFIQSVYPTETQLPAFDAADTSKILFRSLGTWLMHSDGTGLHQIDENLYPLSWSPSGERLLLFRDNKLYLADRDGADIRLLYEDPSSSDFWGSEWLTDEIVLLQSWVTQFDPHVYYLNVLTGELRIPEPNYWRTIKAVAPHGEFWIQRSAEGLSIVNLNDTIIPILEGITISDEDWVNYPEIAFSPNGREIAFTGCYENISSSCAVFRAAISAEGVSSLQAIIDLGDFRSIRQVAFSFDGQYLAALYRDEQLAIWNLESNEPAFYWLFQEKIQPLYIMWAPTSWVLLYEVYSTSPAYTGFKVLDVETGATQVITDGSIAAHIQAWDWR